MLRVGDELSSLAGKDLREGAVVHGDGKVQKNIERLLSEIKDLNLLVSGNTEAVRDLAKVNSELKGAAQDAKLTKAQANKLVENITDLRKTLSAELKGIEAYVLLPKRYDVKRLTTAPGGLFGQGVFSKVPNIAQFDFTEACKCIAFELPTAAAFHLLRGTEDVLKDFYCKKVKQNRISSPFMWGPMVQHMRSKKRLQEFKSLFDHLDNIRVNYRNPTQHPELTYDVAGAENLLGLCIDVVSRMAPHL